MKFTLEEFLVKLQSAISHLPQDAFDSYVEAAANAKGLIDHRITETGKNEKGVSLQDIKAYTEKYLAFKKGTQPLTLQGKRARKTRAANLKAQGETLGKRVTRSNRYRGFVDLTYSGRQWNNTKVLVHESTVSVEGVHIKVGADNELDKIKVEKNAELRGDFLNVSEDELLTIAEALDTEIQNKFDTYFA